MDIANLTNPIPYHILNHQIKSRHKTIPTQHNTAQHLKRPRKIKETETANNSTMPAPVEQTNGGPAPAPVSSNEFFESIGKKANNLGSTTNGTNGTNGTIEDDDEKVVQEIESLCMNCRENVSKHPPWFSFSSSAHTVLTQSD